MKNSEGRRPRSNSRASSHSSIASIQTVHFGGEFGGPVAVGSRGDDGDDVDVDGQEEKGEGMPSVSTDHERQILLLMLLAQVCALHDPTPRTFTVHVLELFERGILDRESIHFLFELGLVPSSSAAMTTLPSRGLLTDGASEDASLAAPSRDELPYGTDREFSTDQWLGSVHADADADDAVDATTPTTTPNTAELALTTTKRPDGVRSLRSLEATAIRRQLSEHDVPDDPKRPSRRVPGGMDGPTHGREAGGGGGGNTGNKPWDVAHFPLSLSRYQREFKQVCLLNAGSFGQVFHAIREMDGCEYAIKRVTFDAMGYSNESIQRVIREVQCLASVNDHPNIVRYYTSWLEPSWMTGSNGGSNSNHNNDDDDDDDDRLQNRRRQIEENPEANLLRDLHNLMQPPRRVDEGMDDEEDGSSYTGTFGKDEASSLFSRESTSTLGKFQAWTRQSSPSQQQKHQQLRQRRLSLDSSVQSIDETSWGSYHSHSLMAWGDAHDDSYLDSMSHRKRPSKKCNPKPAATAPSTTRSQTLSYRYQINLYIQMQLCHPATLADWIRERNRTVGEADHIQRIGPALEIFQQIVNGLAHIHGQKIIHRDLKPANIFASADGKVIKIGDFGLSKQLHDIATSHTSNGTAFGEVDTTTTSKSPTDANKTSAKNPNPRKQQVVTDRDPSSHHEFWQDPKNRAVVPRVGAPSQALVEYNGRLVNEPLTAGIGTASYAAPEQVRSKDYGTAVDIFSLGLILLELVCCFNTEHERLDHFQKCRNQRIPQWVQDHYLDIASTVLACTRPNACDRPTATDLAEIVQVKSPRALLEVHVLKGKLREKEEELAEQGRLIEEMRREIERMKASMLSTTSGLSLGSPTLALPLRSDVDNVLVEDATTFDDDI